ncbi:MAG: WbuC family cupin fold metalloprotein [Kiritimatiellaeota bacterium]|nr:WbuC family cupin fold metalloprotein [Kiritimatiellota bacterium]
MNTYEQNPEVLIAAEPLVTVTSVDVDQLCARALHNVRRRMRLCAHPAIDSKVHEMLIVHTPETYVRPHKHIGKSESFHIVAGTADVILFDENGAIQQVVPMGDYASGRIFYYRVSGPLYHSLVITSDVLVFHEVTNGPFVRTESVFAPWAPDESDPVAVKAFLEDIKRKIIKRPFCQKSRIKLAKFLIIGASGFIGRHTLAQARALGYEAIGTASQSWSEGLIGLDLIRDRLTEKVPTSFFKTEEPVFVIISAANSKIDACYREPEVTRTINVTNTLRLMEDAAALGAHPVFLTSNVVFDGRVGYYTETDPHSPISEYGRQKAEIEAYCRSHHPDWFLVRLDKIVGDDPAENHLFTEWYRWSQAGQPIVCMTNHIFSPTHVGDIAKALILGCMQRLTGLYNVANNEYFARDELARQFFNILGREARIVCRNQAELGFLDLRPEKSYIDASKFIGATGMHFTPMRQVMKQFRAKLSADELQ